ncbi:hypothetical protein ACLESD_03455 [Pyxidicoccus sp. 3LFB2]
MIIEVLKGHTNTDTAVSPETICESLFKYADPELVRVVAQMTTLKGPVQRALNDGGHILCLVRIEETKRGARGSVIRRRTVGRFVTDDDDTIFKHVVETVGNRTVQRVSGDAGFLVGIVLKRRPALVQRMPQFRHLLERRIDEQLNLLPA